MEKREEALKYVNEQLAQLAPYEELGRNDKTFWAYRKAWFMLRDGSSAEDMKTKAHAFRSCLPLPGIETPDAPERRQRIAEVLEEVADLL